MKKDDQSLAIASIDGSIMKAVDADPNARGGAEQRAFTEAYRNAVMNGALPAADATPAISEARLTMFETSQLLDDALPGSMIKKAVIGFGIGAAAYLLVRQMTRAT